MRVFTLIDLFTQEGLALEGRPGSWGADAAAVLAMTPPAFSPVFKRSPMKRAKLRGLKRHAAVVLGSVGTADDIDLLTPLWPVPPHAQPTRSRRRCAPYSARRTEPRGHIFNAPNAAQAGSFAGAGLRTRCSQNSLQERATGLEPATSSLGSWHSTN